MADIQGVAKLLEVILQVRCNDTPVFLLRNSIVKQNRVEIGTNAKLYSQLLSLPLDF